MIDARPLRILVAADKFKGSLSGSEACEAIADGLREALGERVEITTSPVADGGEGMAPAITAARGGEWHTATVSDPLGRPVEAGFGLITDPDGQTVGVIEMAEASGLWRLSAGELDPLRASTRGTGELIRIAAERGATRLLLGIGGSATNDGGVGMATALGFRFRGIDQELIEDLPLHLTQVDNFEKSPHSLPEVVVACDVTNPLMGPNGCTAIYGPQKGVSEATFALHEARLAHLVALTGPEGSRLAKTPGAGAAGGLGFGCLAFLDATLRPGFDLVADVLNLASAVQEADLVITGEGKLDRQTLQGKAPAGVAALARSFDKPVAALAGCLEDGAESRFDFVAAIDAGSLSLEDSMKKAASLLRETARKQGPAITALVAGRS